MKFIFQNFPIPPTTNQLYKNIGGNRRAKSQKYNQWLRLAQLWSFRNSETLKNAAEFFCKRIEQNEWVEISLYLCLNPSTIISKKGEIKIYDASNRIKATHDLLSKVMKIDDKYFSVGTTQKVFTKDEERAVVILKPTPILDDTQIFDMEQ